MTPRDRVKDRSNRVYLADHENGPGRPIREDEFSASWTGYLVAPASGDYTFEAEADDFVRVWVGGEMVVDIWPEGRSGSGGPAARRSIHLQAGTRYPIRADYREETLNASVHLFWSRDEGLREVVPVGSFFNGEDPSGRPGLNACYTSLQEYLVYTVKGEDLFVITFEWPDEELAVPIREPLPGTEVTLLGRDGPLPWRYEAGVLSVDFSGVPYSEIPGDWAWTIRLPGYLPSDGGPER